MRMSALGERYGVSRQRIHQIVKNYSTIDPKWKKSKRIKKLLDSGCFNCKNLADVIHHKDGNTHNNLSENLLPLCTDCHYSLHAKIREKKNYKYICVICKRENIVKFETPLLRQGKQICEECVHWKSMQKRRKTDRKTLRQYEKLPNCIECGLLFTEEDPYHQSNLHLRCFAKIRYATNAEYREKHRVLVNRWAKTHPEEMRIMQKRSQAKYRSNPEIKLKMNNYSRQYYKRNSEKYKAEFKQYYLDHKEEIRIRAHERYLKKKLAKEQLAML